MHRLAILFAILVLGTMLGCGSGAEPKRSRVSGTVTFEGKPIPYGTVLITPDGAKKNTGRRESRSSGTASTTHQLRGGRATAAARR